MGKGSVELLEQRSGAPWRLPAPSTTGRQRRPRSSERAANRPGAVSGTRQSNEPRCDERARGKARFRNESGTELPESLIVCVIRRRSSLHERFQFAGTSDKRLKGLEPSTFCMANGTASGLSTTFHLQMTSISVLTTPPSTRIGCRQIPLISRGFPERIRNGLEQPSVPRPRAVEGKHEVVVSADGSVATP